MHEVRVEDALAALDAFQSSSRLSARDAVFVALAARLDIDAILSTDRDFDGLRNLERIDPEDATAVQGLAAA